MPKEKNSQEKIKNLIEESCQKESVNILGWRTCPTQTGDLGWSVLPSTPDVFQIFLKGPMIKKHRMILKENYTYSEGA